MSSKGMIRNKTVLVDVPRHLYASMHRLFLPVSIAIFLFVCRLYARTGLKPISKARACANMIAGLIAGDLIQACESTPTPDLRNLTLEWFVLLLHLALAQLLSHREARHASIRVPVVP